MYTIHQYVTYKVYELLGRVLGPIRSYGLFSTIKEKGSLVMKSFFHLT